MTPGISVFCHRGPLELCPPGISGTHPSARSWAPIHVAAHLTSEANTAPTDHPIRREFRSPFAITFMESFKHLAGLGSLKSWLASNLPWIKSGGTLAPRAVVLAGLPGTGKNTTARAIASALGMPLARYGEIPTENLPSLPALLVEEPSAGHLPLVRQLADLESKMPFTIILAERPWELPAGILRPDVIDTIWHLDLPDFHERCEIWELAAGRHGLAPHEFDQVVLSRASHESAQADIHAAFIRAARARHPHPPKEKHLLEALSELQPVARARHDELARMTCWSSRCSVPAR